MTDTFITYRVPTPEELGELSKNATIAFVEGFSDEKKIKYALSFGSFSHLVYVPTWEELGVKTSTSILGYDESSYPEAHNWSGNWVLKLEPNYITKDEYVFASEIEARWFVAVLIALEAGL